MQTSSSILLVMTTLPDTAIANVLARTLVEKRLAACVQICAPVQAVYRWQDAVEHAEEVPLTIKTTSVCYAQVEALILEMHPYAAPEILAVPITIGSPDYLRWAQDACVSPTTI